MKKKFNISEFTVACLSVSLAHKVDVPNKVYIVSRCSASFVIVEESLSATPARCGGMFERLVGATRRCLR